MEVHDTVQETGGKIIPKKKKCKKAKSLSEEALQIAVKRREAQYFGHLMRRVCSLVKTLMLGKIESRRRRGGQRMR